jgi:hypothetical protein
MPYHMNNAHKQKSKRLLIHDLLHNLHRQYVGVVTLNCIISECSSHCYITFLCVCVEGHVYLNFI